MNFLGVFSREPIDEVVILAVVRAVVGVVVVVSALLEASESVDSPHLVVVSCVSDRSKFFSVVVNLYLLAAHDCLEGVHDCEVPISWESPFMAEHAALLHSQFGLFVGAVRKPQELFEPIFDELTVFVCN